MTCISPIKSHIVLKMVSNGGYDNIIPSCTIVLKSFDFLFEEILTKPFEFSEKIRKTNGGIRRKTDISCLLKDLESYIER